MQRTKEDGVGMGVSLTASVSDNPGQSWMLFVIK